MVQIIQHGFFPNLGCLTKGFIPCNGFGNSAIIKKMNTRLPKAKTAMADTIIKRNLAKIALNMTSSLNLQDVLSSITRGLVDEISAAFARIWLVEPGDLCASCQMAPNCPDKNFCLHLKASSGLYSSLNGQYRRVPLDALKIGRIASSKTPVCTNRAMGDPRIRDQHWLQENGFKSFAGYPLIFRDEVLGVMALFSSQVISQSDFKGLALFANQAATAIKNAKLFNEVEALNKRLELENVYLHQEIKRHSKPSETIGESPAFLKVLSMVEQVAVTDATVLVLGETGTGKELIARAIHNSSTRANAPFVTVNCSALPANLIESELFGHKKGAFTGASFDKSGRFQIADKGSLFLDEIGDFDSALQPKLLRVLQEGTFEKIGDNKSVKVNVRIIAATNADLEKSVEAGTFRQDLYYRLNVFPILLPPLRERQEDILPLAQYFVRKYNTEHKKQVESISPAFAQALQNYMWPGNVRELENIIERAVILSRGPELRLDDSFHSLATSAPPTGNKSLRIVEKAHILSILNQCGWVIEGPKGAARILEIHPATLRSRLKKLDIQRPA